MVALFGTVQFDAVGMVDNFIIHYGPGRDWFERLQIRSHFFSGSDLPMLSLVLLMCSPLF